MLEILFKELKIILIKIKSHLKRFYVKIII